LEKPPAPLAAWTGALAVALPLIALCGALIGPGGPLSPWLLVTAVLIGVLAECSVAGRRAPLPAALALGLVLLTDTLTQIAAADARAGDPGSRDCRAGREVMGAPDAAACRAAAPLADVAWRRA
jgi:hypothetical protein